MEWDPAARVEIGRVAMPPLRLTVPIAVPASEKMTEPVGVPDEDATVAVNVMLLWRKAAAGDPVKLTVGVALLMVRVPLPVAAL